eukprot:2962382-Ditylum_brightwellii.AAC.1
MDHTTQPTNRKWSEGCALGFCVCVIDLECQPPDESDPNAVEIKPGEKNKDSTLKVHKPVTKVKGTYCIKGQ